MFQEPSEFLGVTGAWQITEKRTVEGGMGECPKIQTRHVMTQRPAAMGWEESCPSNGASWVRWTNNFTNKCIMTNQD